MPPGARSCYDNVTVHVMEYCTVSRHDSLSRLIRLRMFIVLKAFRIVSH
jgi:hypothetical protein